MNSLTSKNSDDPSVSLIQNYLDRYGWAYELIEQDTIVTGFSVEENIFTMFIRCNNNMLYFSIPNFANSPDEKYVLEAYQYFLKANLDLVFGKFALDDNGMIGFFVEIPVSVISYDFFSLILHSIGANVNEQVNYIS